LVVFWHLNGFGTQTKQWFYLSKKKFFFQFFFFLLGCKSMHVLLIVLVARVGPHGQLDSIKLKFPEKAIPGSVGAVVYLTGESVVILFDVSLN